MKRRCAKIQAIIFFLYWLLICLFYFAAKSDIMSFVGGIGESNRQVNLIGIIKWNLLVMPPITACVLYQTFIDSDMSIIIKHRYGSFKRLWRNNISLFAVINYIYAVIPAAVIAIDDFSSAIYVTAILPLFTLSVSVICSSAICAISSMRYTIYIYMLVCGITPILITVYPQWAKYIYASYGMVLQSEKFCSNGINSAIGVLILLLVNFLAMSAYYKILKLSRRRIG